MNSCLQDNLRKHILVTSIHPGKFIYECKFCNSVEEERFKCNFAKEFKVHLVTSHPDEFGSSGDAATFIAGIYESSDDIVLNISKTSFNNIQ